MLVKGAPGVRSVYDENDRYIERVSMLCYLALTMGNTSYVRSDDD